jgi:hypothetical protein
VTGSREHGLPFASRHLGHGTGRLLPPDLVSDLEASAHEVQHVKLDALLNLTEPIKADAGSRYYAPWRPVPRPANALSQGACTHFCHVRPSGSILKRCDAFKRPWGDAVPAGHAGRVLGGTARLPQVTTKSSGFPGHREPNTEAASRLFQ